MTTFAYKAIRGSGERYEGTREAPDKFALYRELKKGGDVVISAEAVKSGSLGLSFKLPRFFGRVRLHDKVIFAKNMAGMMDAGLALSRALSVLERQTKQKYFKSVIENIGKDISKGETLSQSMAKTPDVFSRIFISMVRAGEESGGLAGSLRLVSEQLERTYLLRKKIKGAMTYPVIILGIMGVIGVLMLTYIVPKMTATFKELDIELPLSTRLVVGTSDLLRNNFILTLAGLIIFTALVVTYLRTPRGKKLLDYLILKLPVIGTISKETNAARTARTLSSLLSSGVDVVIAMNITAEVVPNSYYKVVLKEAEKAIEKGQPLSAVFAEHSDLYPVFVGEMVSVGEETGKLSEMFMEVAKFYENEVEQKTKDLSTIIEPVLMVVIGVVVGFFALAMLSPTYSLMDKL